MTNISLKRLLGKKYHLSKAIEELVKAFDEPIAVRDTDGRVLIGMASGIGPEASEAVPIMVEGEPVGSLILQKNSRLQPHLASLVSFIVQQEADKRALAAEALDKYRELHLLYQLSDKLITSPKVEEIAAMTLGEICPLFQVTHGMILLKQEGDTPINIIATCGNPFQIKMNAWAPGGMVERVIENGSGEIYNLVDANQFLDDTQENTISILSAPLKTEKHVLGAIVMICNTGRQFTAGDLKLLNAIAMQTAPAIEIAQLHQIELEKTKLERDLQLARQVQVDLLPRKMPTLPGWQIAAYWQPALIVSGDFYDFIEFPDGKVGLVIADVAGKGMSAALVMVNTRSILRAMALSSSQRGPKSPGSILARVNNLLCKEMPAGLFVTCLMVILDPRNGEVRFANAGHNLPFLSTLSGVSELKATGMPLGIFPNLTYEEQEAHLGFGDSLLMYSDGLAEAHNPQGEMFGYPRLSQYLTHPPGITPMDGDELIHFLMDRLGEFTGSITGFEDDVTMVTLQRELETDEASQEAHPD
jgi:serine phosphatase RsbU (regulator of sigma subunit)